MIGLGRPLCWQPDLPRRLLAREVDHVARVEDRLRFAERGWRSPTSPLVIAKVLNTFGAQSWYYCQLFRLADGKPADLQRGMLSSLGEYLRDELSRGLRGGNRGHSPIFRKENRRSVPYFPRNHSSASWATRSGCSSGSQCAAPSMRS